MLSIDSISNGIVIDHIEAGKGIKIFEKLDLYNADFTVALIMNASSKRHGRKDLIKIENTMDIDLTMLGYIDSNITINYIKDEKIVKKINLSLPEKLEGVIECKNPRCITSIEREINQKFRLVDKELGLYRCEYCDQMYKQEV